MSPTAYLPTRLRPYLPLFLRRSFSAPATGYVLRFTSSAVWFSHQVLFWLKSMSCCVQFSIQPPVPNQTCLSGQLSRLTCSASINFQNTGPNSMKISVQELKWKICTCIPSISQFIFVLFQICSPRAVDRGWGFTNRTEQVKKRESQKELWKVHWKASEICRT